MVRKFELHKEGCLVFKYLLLFFGGLIADRLTKMVALVRFQQDVEVCSFLKFSLAWNRGISWNMLDFKNPLLAKVLTGVIFFVIFFFGIYTLLEHLKKRNIVFEVVVLAGALSNFVDRVLYGAVIDFIEVYYKTVSFPTFNVADMLIVVGVCGILIKNWFQQEAVRNEGTV